MNNSSSNLRGDLRVASFLLLAVGMMLGFPHPATTRAADGYTVRLTVGSSGFEPKRIAVPLGSVHFSVTSREGDHCFAIPSVDVEKRVRSARPLEMDVTFDHAGEYPFLCCVESSGTAEVGVIVVAAGK